MSAITAIPLPSFVSFVVKGFAFSDPRSSALISGRLLLFRAQLSQDLSRESGKRQPLSGVRWHPSAGCGCGGGRKNKNRIISGGN
jgi:hypothetical protein